MEQYDEEGESASTDGAKPPEEERVLGGMAAP